MKNVKFIFTDADYELVTKAYEQYERLAKDYYNKELLFDLFDFFVTMLMSFPVFLLAQCIINAKFVGLINLIIIVCTIIFTIILSVLFIRQSVIYKEKMNQTKKYGTNCLNIKNDMEKVRKTGGRLEFEIDTIYDGTIESNKLFYRIRKPTFAIRKYPVIENEIPYTDNVVLRLKETTDKYGFVSYVWQAESA